jgi:hypothetical protein
MTVLRQYNSGTSSWEAVVVGASALPPIIVTDSTTSTAASGFGFMGVPQVLKSASYTVQVGDAGKHIYMTATGQTITIPSNSTTAFPIGTTLTFINGSAVTTTIAITSDTLTLAFLGSTGSRTLAPWGMATAIKLTSTMWIIGGNGLT